MKKILIAILVCTTTISIAQKKQKTKPVVSKNKIKESAGLPFVINGTLLGYKGKTIVFAPFLDQNKRDTIPVVNEKFVYSGKINETEVFIYLREDGQSNSVFIDPAVHNLNIDCIENKGFGINNAPAQESYNNFITAINPLVEKRKTYSEGEPQAKNDNEALIQKTFKDFLSNPQSHPTVTSFLVYNNINQMQGASEQQLMEFYNQLTEPAQKTIFAKKALQFIQKNSADDIGKIAPDFTLLDSAGKKVTLSQFRNKNYVLVDFWATWCGPCRGEFPALKAAYEKYKSKGLVILGVSIDADKAKWKKMLAQPDFTTWTHVWDGPQGPNQVASALYNVPSIPRNFLLDKTGKVIARNLRGASVESTLEQMIK